MTAPDFKLMLTPTTKSQAMLKTRSAYLTQLYNAVGNDATDLSFLNNTTAVLKFIRNSDNVNSQKTRIFHVIAAVRLARHGRVVTPKAKDLYKRLADELKVAGTKIYTDNVMSDAQRAKFMSLAALNSHLETATIDLFNDYDLRKTPVITDDEWTRLVSVTNRRKPNSFTFGRDLQTLVVLASYVWQPAIRNDYGTLHITRKAIGLTKDRNWLQVRKNGSMNLVMYEYKNAKSMGKKTLPIESEKLRWIYGYWINLLERMLGAKPVKLFYYTINANHTISLVGDERTIGRQISRMSSKIFGKPLSINDFRHIHEDALQKTDEYRRGTLQERIAMHEKLLHGHHMGVQYAVVRRDENTDSNEA